MTNITVTTDIASDSEQELSALRQKIDEIDEKIIQQLITRIEIVKQVGELKQKAAIAPCPIRSGREAEMIRRVVERFRSSDFPAAAAASIWRTIIGASTGVESDLTLSIFFDEKESALYWLAREYFGVSTPIIKQPHIKRIIGDLMDGKAAVGIVPFFSSSDNSNLWTVLMQNTQNSPKIFARIPFVYNDAQGKDMPAALAIARLMPEASGDDVSLMVIEIDKNVSQSRLQTLFTGVNLEVSWINIATINPVSRHHLLEIKGFVTTEHQEFSSALTSLGRAVFGSCFLGAYATPVNLANL